MNAFAFLRLVRSSSRFLLSARLFVLLALLKSLPAFAQGIEVSGPYHSLEMFNVAQCHRDRAKLIELISDDFVAVSSTGTSYSRDKVLDVNFVDNMAECVSVDALDVTIQDSNEEIVLEATLAYTFKNNSGSTFHKDLRGAFTLMMRSGEWRYVSAKYSEIFPKKAQ